MKKSYYKEFTREIERLENVKAFRRRITGIFNTVITVAALASLVALFVFPVLRISSPQMEPTLAEGDMVVALAPVSISKGDIAAFYFGNTILTKRIIATGGDIVDIDEGGSVIVNGVRLSEPYITSKGTSTEFDVEFPFTVPPDEMFVLGDNRTMAIDSRYTILGTVRKDQLIGKVFLRIWPLDKFKFI